MADCALCSDAPGTLHRMTENYDDRRRRPRLSTMILCELRIGELPPQLVRVRDLSECGVKIATDRKLLLGDRVRIKLPGTGDWSLARVAWCAQGVAGLSFSRAIDLPGVAGARALDDQRPGRRLLPLERIAS